MAQEKSSPRVKKQSGKYGRKRGKHPHKEARGFALQRKKTIHKIHQQARSPQHGKQRAHPHHNRKKWAGTQHASTRANMLLEIQMDNEQTGHKKLARTKEREGKRPCTHTSTPIHYSSTTDRKRHSTHKHTYKHALGNSPKQQARQNKRKTQ